MPVPRTAWSRTPPTRASQGKADAASREKSTDSSSSMLRRASLAQYKLSEPLYQLMEGDWHPKCCPKYSRKLLLAAANACPLMRTMHTSIECRGNFRAEAQRGKEQAEFQRLVSGFHTPKPRKTDQRHIGKGIATTPVAPRLLGEYTLPHASPPAPAATRDPPANASGAAARRAAFSTARTPSWRA